MRANRAIVVDAARAPVETAPPVLLRACRPAWAGAAKAPPINTPPTVTDAMIRFSSEIPPSSFRAPVLGASREEAIR
jgi:hypothetical protein